LTLGVRKEIQSDWISELCPASGILNTRKHNVFETRLFSSSGEGRETRTLLGPLKGVNITHWLSWLTISNGPNRASVSLNAFVAFRISDYEQIPGTQ
jgi:hypothetical protein